MAAAGPGSVCGWVRGWNCSPCGVTASNAPPHPVLDNLGRFALTPGAWFVNAYERQEIQVFNAADPQAGPVVVKSRHVRVGSLFLGGALQADRCVLDHTGGVVEVLDGQGRSVMALRPFPALARKDNAGVGTPSADGRFVLCGGGGLAALDLRAGLAGRATSAHRPCPTTTAWSSSPR
jgi:hypothetical protein